MAKQKETLPFVEVRQSYEAALKEYVQAASMLASAVGVIMKLAENEETDGKRLIKTLGEHHARFEAASYGAQP